MASNLAGAQLAQKGDENALKKSQDVVVRVRYAPQATLHREPHPAD